MSLVTQPNILVPLDGKTSLDSQKLLTCMNNFHNEMKAEMERLYQVQLIKQRDEIFKTIAVLLQSNYKQVVNNDGAVESYEGQINRIIDVINKGLENKPSKKGRPKKKTNPWHHVLD